ncbi:hypothetical protein CYMTET_28417 [Cymbomonas tetramitiformis]|uniref:Uncharacterized protein n=1 Tax=Cymbomonas tetramitiformis TaxID=36881 RepID=A0AAE0FPE6_9CHLO|nr:hypothetical protein CYMTET_28417 [Cymbomonas tetramitiformis]
MPSNAAGMPPAESSVRKGGAAHASAPSKNWRLATDPKKAASWSGVRGASFLAAGWQADVLSASSVNEESDGGRQVLPSPFCPTAPHSKREWATQIDAHRGKSQLEPIRPLTCGATCRRRLEAERLNVPRHSGLRSDVDEGGKSSHSHLEPDLVSDSAGSGE